MPVAVEEIETGLHHVLENEVLVVVALVDDIRVDDVVDGRLPLLKLVCQLRKVVYLFLSDVCVKYFLVDSAPERRWDASLRILN